MVLIMPHLSQPPLMTSSGEHLLLGLLCKCDNKIIVEFPVTSKKNSVTGVDPHAGNGLQNKNLFLARLHFSAEELLLYPRRPRPRPHAKC